MKTTHKNITGWANKKWILTGFETICAKRWGSEARFV